MIPLREQEAIQQKFVLEMRGRVKIDYFTERELALEVPGRRPCATCKPTRLMLQELAALHDAISLRVHYFDEAREERTSFGVERIPAIVLRGGDSVFTFYGMPGGTEFQGFVESIVDLSRGEVLLSEESVKALKKLKEDVSVRVFVTPTCPYCPPMARAVLQLAMVSGHVQVEVIEVSEFPELAERYKVRSVPLTVIADRLTIAGLVHERVLAEQVVKAVGSSLAETTNVSGPTTAVEIAQPAARRGGERTSGLVIP